MTTESGFGPDEAALDALGLPAIPVSAGALIFDRVGGLLILKPHLQVRLDGSWRRHGGRRGDALGRVPA